jgi:hypothetical protein
MDEDTTYTIRQMDGKVINTRQIVSSNNPIKINVNQFVEGTYLLLIKSGK